MLDVRDTAKQFTSHHTTYIPHLNNFVSDIAVDAWDVLQVLGSCIIDLDFLHDCFRNVYHEDRNVYWEIQACLKKEIQQLIPSRDLKGIVPSVKKRKQYCSYKITPSVKNQAEK